MVARDTSSSLTLSWLAILLRIFRNTQDCSSAFTWQAFRLLRERLIRETHKGFQSFAQYSKIPAAAAYWLLPYRCDWHSRDRPGQANAVRGAIPPPSCSDSCHILFKYWIVLKCNRTLTGVSIHAAVFVLSGPSDILCTAMQTEVSRHSLLDLGILCPAMQSEISHWSSSKEFSLYCDVCWAH